jgi:hypothetical protein
MVLRLVQLIARLAMSAFERALAMLYSFEITDSLLGAAGRELESDTYRHLHMHRHASPAAPA